ncbi:MAG: hypothetical protein U0136_00905 [Bdellovibrionota bacterium]
MLYFEWFEALKSLLFGPNADKLSSLEHGGLFVLGNMLMPEETHLIRLGRDNPRSFDQSVTPLAKRPDLYGDGFYLPYPGVVVEDDMSAIGFVDLDSHRPKGLSRQRMFISIETPSSIRNGPAPQTLMELIALAQVQLSFPEDTFFLTWGAIDSVTNMNIDHRLARLNLSLWGVAGFSKDRLHFAEMSKWFISYVRRQPGGSSVDPAMDTLLSRIGGSLAQNLLFGLLQVAYANALLEEKPK